jgi:hypothetical protein
MKVPINSRILSADTCKDMYGIHEPHYQLLHLDNVTPVVGGVFKLNYRTPGANPGISSEKQERVVQKPRRELEDDEGWIRVESPQKAHLRRSLQRLREKAE